jgi:hypothetical protein
MRIQRTVMMISIYISISRTKHLQNVRGISKFDILGVY